MDTVSVLTALGLGMTVVGGILRVVAITLWRPVDPIEAVSMAAGAVLGLLLTLVAALRRPTGLSWSDIGVTGLFLVLGGAAMAVGVMITANGLFDRSPGETVPVVVEAPGQRLATVRVMNGMAKDKTFQIAARIGTVRVGQTMTARIHPGALGRQWADNVP